VEHPAATTDNLHPHSIPTRFDPPDIPVHIEIPPLSRRKHVTDFPITNRSPPHSVIGREMQSLVGWRYVDRCPNTGASHGPMEAEPQ